MRTTYFKKVRVLRYSPELKSRALRVNHKDLHSVAEFIIDVFYLYTVRPVLRSEFTAVVVRSLCASGPPVGSYGVFINEMVHIALNAVIACGAIKYTPRTNLLPGETE